MRIKRLRWLALLLALLLLAACEEKSKSGRVEIDAGQNSLEGTWKLDYYDTLAANLDQGGEAAVDAIHDEMAYYINFDLQGHALLSVGLDGDHLLALDDVRSDGGRYVLSAGGKTYEVEVLGNGRALFRYKGLALVLERPWTNPGDREVRNLAGAWKVESSNLPDFEAGSFVQLAKSPEMLIYYDNGFERAWVRPYRLPAGEFNGFVVYLDEGVCVATVRDAETIEIKSAEETGLVLKKRLPDSGMERLNGLWEVSVEDSLARISELDGEVLERISEVYIYLNASFPGACSVSLIERGEKAPDGFTRLDPLDFPLEVAPGGIFEARLDRVATIRGRFLDDGLLLVSEVRDTGDEVREKEICLLRPVRK
ncbi:MAG: hypothetical protein LBM64_00775 [Deltaproteobacteria bacterium]|jgi:hypothetical protein|nr:hypothetical protein [Deltaproteobacteria bacterium]